VCYAGTGFNLCGTVTKRSLSEFGTAESAELWSGRFERATGQDSAHSKEAVEVTWGWGTGGTWYAAENPRFTFAGNRMIYKLYAQRSVRGDAPPSPAATDLTTTTFLIPFLRAMSAAVTGQER
jgi:hypothetical protein